MHDHTVTAMVGGKKVTTFPDCEVGSFVLSYEKNWLSLRVIAKKVNGSVVAPLGELINQKVRFQIKRAKHWSEQRDLLDDDGVAGGNEGDADKQTEISDAEQKKRQRIERQKDVANKRNSAKARADKESKADSDKKALANAAGLAPETEGAEA